MNIITISVDSIGNIEVNYNKRTHTDTVVRVLAEALRVVKQHSTMERRTRALSIKRERQFKRLTQNQKPELN